MKVTENEIIIDKAGGAFYVFLACALILFIVMIRSATADMSDKSDLRSFQRQAVALGYAEFEEHIFKWKVNK